MILIITIVIIIDIYIYREREREIHIGSTVWGGPRKLRADFRPSAPAAGFLNLAVVLSLLLLIIISLLS